MSIGRSTAAERWKLSLNHNSVTQLLTQYD